MIYLPKISVIVPIYKAEKYLRRCINSVLAQTNEKWELILVDDGSPDNCGKICDEYALKDSRIRVFHKENGGVSSARNMGLDNACGEWITFLDADDYISIDYLNCIKISNCDIILGCSKIIMQDASTTTLEKLSPVYIENIGQLKKFLQENLVVGLMRVPWGKLIKRNIIGNIRFAIGQNIGEDTLFMLQIFQNVQSLSIDNSRIYYWQKDIMDDKYKYRLTPENAIKFVGNIYTAYRVLDIHATTFETFLLTYYFDLCDKREAYKLWFKNSIVLKLQSRNPKLLPIYRVWQVCPVIAPFFERFYCLLAKIKRNYLMS